MAYIADEDWPKLKRRRFLKYRICDKTLDPNVADTIESGLNSSRPHAVTSMLDDDA